MLLRNKLISYCTIHKIAVLKDSDIVETINEQDMIFYAVLSHSIDPIFPVCRRQDLNCPAKYLAIADQERIFRILP